MRCLLVYCHPCPESFSAAIRDTAADTLKSAGHDVQILDLYGEAFDPILGPDERRNYNDVGINEEPVRDRIDQIRWAEMLVFVYPTWWYGLPAMLKGWLDRVWVPHVTFVMPTETTPIQPNMQHISKIAVITTCGATWWITKLMGEPGRKTLLRGIRALAGRQCKTMYMAMYKMDTSRQGERERFLSRVRAKLARF